MNVRALLAVLLLFGAAAYVVFVPRSFDVVLVFKILPGLGLIALGVAVCRK